MTSPDPIPDTPTPAKRPCLCRDLGLLLARVPFGLFFLLAGVGKIRGGIGNFVAHASGQVPSWLPANMGHAYLHALPFVEITTGLLAIIGLFTRAIGAIQALMLISFMIAAGIKPPAGPFHFNFVFVGIALMLALVGPGRLSIDALIFKPRRVKQ
jgi:putative oxidoreductase